MACRVMSYTKEYAYVITWLESTQAVTCQFSGDIKCEQEFSYSTTNQHPRTTIQKISPYTFAHLVTECPPRLIIIQYSCFDYRTNLSHVLAAWSALFTWSLCTTCAKDHRIVVFYAISELPFASASKRVLVQSLLYENFIRTSSLVHWHVNKTNFHRYSFAPELALKQRRKVRKWPITYKSTSLEYPIVCLLH